MHDIPPLTFQQQRLTQRPLAWIETLEDLYTLSDCAQFSYRTRMLLSAGWSSENKCEQVM